MNKELSDAAWRVLSSEFKEEVKKEWKTANNEERLSHDAFLRGCYSTMTLLFGLHNLTSDAEGEEMLTVSRKNVQKMYSYNEEELTKDPTNKGALLLKLRLDALFGSKCLPDEGTDCTPVEVGVAENATTSNVDSLEPKPSEPKFKEGDIVRYRYDGKLYIVECKTGKYHYALRQYDCDIMIHDALESDLEPYTEPTANYLRSEGALNTAVLAGNYSSASTCDKQFDNIIKDGFKNHNRLHIAAILAAGMLASEVRCYPVDRALELADKLIAECEKGDNNA